MTRKREIYRCPICGNVVEVLHQGAVLTCCGKAMQLVGENTTDGAVEKHVPVVEAADGVLRVSVGSVAHPMTDGHYIEWIELLTPTCVLRRELHPGDRPEAVFRVGQGSGCSAAACGVPLVSVRAYCNLHGLWRHDE